MIETTRIAIADDAVLEKIYMIRNQKVMLDKDLAELYGIKAIRLREQVKRNKDRFPEKFMMQLTEDEVETMVSQNAIPSKQTLGGALPFVFTEHGVLMLSNVLKSDQAIQMSIRIIEVFVNLREAILLHKDVSLLVEHVERKMIKQDGKIEALYSYLSKFMEQSKEPRTAIGYKQKNRQ
ncbi:MAG: ORF6N domain-containing protein [Pedobacter sp.]|nr:MAG: ORF6N domain-containing protein [Pedobacter sp.]